MALNIEAKQTVIGVVGAGNMGAGIAQKYAMEGFPVVVVDVDDAAAQRGKARVQATLTEGVQRKLFTPEKAEEILGRMRFTGDRDALVGAALIVEAVFEDLKVKRDLFTDLDSRCGPETLLATNTSSFLVDDLAPGLKHPERVLGLHYFYHPAKNRLVEVIAGTKTSPAAFERAWAIQERSGKTPIRSGDAPGFIVNRFFVPWINEAMRLVEEKVADIPTVEAAAKQAFGVGMGPFELMNVTGVPITLHAATTLGEKLSPFYAPCDLIRPVVERKETWTLGGTPDASKVDVVADRLWGVVAQIACRLVFDEKVCTLEDCDLGARVGLRWPMGPFEAMNQMGTPKALARVEAIVKRYPDLTVPEALKAAAAKQAPFPIRFVETRVEGGVGHIVFNRPDSMNALNETVVAQLGEAFDAMTNDPQVKGIVLEGKGKAFVAGADTKYFVDQLRANDVDRIVRFAAQGQALFERIDRSKKTVVCKLHGLSLGGGSELALACDFIVASPRGSMGFPETGIGIYPGLGGTQRSARRVGVPLARWLVFTGDTLDAKTAHAVGMVDEVVAPEQLDDAARRRALSGETRPETAPPTRVPAGFEGLAKLFDVPLSTLREGKAELPVGPEGEKLGKTLKKVSFKAPRALEASDTLLTMAKNRSLAEGLKAETEGLDAIFRTADALEGLSTIGVRRPSFQGK
jgi:enoyl-CoA hydratase/3-hydroxyacyl-CoA dehydrogenase